MNARPGRNEPCPCASGRKYKKCCLDAAERTPAPGRVLGRADLERLERGAELHALDRKLVERVLAFGGAFDGWRPEDRFAMDLAKEPVGMMLFAPWAAYEYRDAHGHSMADRFLEEHEASLAPVERAWLQAQARSSLSAWEVLEATPGLRLRLRDVFTGEERTVIERKGSESLAPREAVLARVIDFEGMSLVCGMHPRSLGPREAQRFADVVRRAIGGRRNACLTTADLRVPAHSEALVAGWEGVLGALAKRPPPKHVNTDGEPLVLVTDTYALVGEVSLARVHEALLALRYAAEDDSEEVQRDPSSARERGRRRGVNDVVFIRDNPPGSYLENTVLGRIRLSGRTMIVDANSRERALSFRDQIERACEGLVVFGTHEEQEASELVQRNERPGERPQVPRARVGTRESAPPQLRAQLRALKARSYRDWCDRSIPALGGNTPREAARSGSSRAKRELELQLKEIEHREALACADERFDVQELRRELAMFAATTGQQLALVVRGG